MSEKLTDHGPFLNTDRELWREPPGDYYASSVHVTESGQIGINVGGMVFVKSLRQWHEAAKDHAAAEERGRRAGIETMQLGTCRVYRHGCADGRAIESHLSDHWREYALPHPKRENCHEWVALAPRDSAPGLKLRSDPRFDPDDEIAPRDSAPKPGISDEKIRELLQRGERDRRIAEGNNVAPRDSGKESDHG